MQTEHAELTAEITLLREQLKLANDRIALQEQMIKYRAHVVKTAMGHLRTIDIS